MLINCKLYSHHFSYLLLKRFNDVLLFLADVGDNEEGGDHIEITVRMDVRHPPDNVTPSHPTQGACSIDAGASELTPANVSSVQTNQHGLGQGVKRMRFAEHEPTSQHLLVVQETLIITVCIKIDITLMYLMFDFLFNKRSLFFLQNKITTKEV